MVSLPPDIVFTAGVASTQYIPIVFVNYNATGEPLSYGDDCGALVTSNVQGVSIQDTYCFWDIDGSCQYRDAGDPAAVDHAESYFSPAVYRNYDTNHLRAVPVYYDGSAPAGTSGTIDIGLQDEFGTPNADLGRVNVYIVASSTPTWFTATSTSTNVSGDSYTVDNALTNGNGGAMLFISHRFSGTFWPHPTAVWYDATIAKWKIRNEDGATMPAGLTFNVRYEPPGSLTASWVAACGTSRFHFCTPSNNLIIDDWRTNGNPYATILISGHEWGTGRINHKVAVAYVSPHWEIITTDGQNFQTNDSLNGIGFNVKIAGASQYADDTLSGDASGFTNTAISNGVGTDINGPFRVGGTQKFLSDWCFTTQGLVPMLVTQNVTPLPPPAPHNYSSVDPDYFGVNVAGNVMTVIHETSTKTMPNYSAFNVWAPYQTGCAPY